MGLSTRELLLIIRARDEATRVLGRFAMTLDKSNRAALNNSLAQGAALTSIGATMAAVGVATIRTLDVMADAHIEYAQKAAVSFTQVEDKADTSLERIKKMGLDTASRFAVDFKQIQPAIYDIFSSIEVSGDDAIKVLNGISKAAIGGATTLEVAGNSIIGILNAWGLTAKDVGRINDQMFQLVRKGRGTFEQFTAAMGKAIPSAKSAGQSVEEVSAMLMLMTRSGVTTAMAGTSAARAMDLLANPKFAENMRDIGMSVYDASGNFKPMSKIIDEIRNKFKDLNPGERAKEIKGLLGGAGNNIQARRFLNLALGDTNKLYKQMQGYAKDAGGAANEAYNIMKNTPAAKLQLMKNEWEILKVTFGEAASAVKIFIVEAITPLIKWFNALSPEVKKNIIIISGIVAAILILSGIIIAAVGGFFLLSGAMAAVGTAMAPVIAITLGIVAAIALLVAGGIWLYQNWGMVSAQAVSIWETIKNAFINGWNAIVSFFAGIPAWASGLWQTVVDATVTAWNSVVSFLGGIWNAIVSSVVAFGAAIIAPWTQLFADIGNVISIGWTLIQQLFAVAFLVIYSIFTGNWALLGQTVWAFMTTVQQTIANLMTGIISFFINGWNNMSSTVSSAWSRIVSAVSNGVNMAIAFIASLPGRAVAALVSFGSYLASSAGAGWRAFIAACQTGGRNVISFISGIPARIKDALSSAASMMYNVGVNIVQGLINGIRSMIDNVISWARNLVISAVNAAKNAVGIKSPSRVWANIGVMSGLGLVNGLKAMRSSVTAAGRELALSAVSMVPDIGIGMNPALAAYGAGSYLTGNKVDVTVNTQEIDPVKHSADLGYELDARLNP